MSQHISEKNAALKTAKHYNCKLKVFAIPALGELGSSALTDQTIDVPDFAGNGKIPVTYVPSRNIIFLSIFDLFSPGVNTFVTSVFLAFGASGGSARPRTSQP